MIVRCVASYDSGRKLRNSCVVKYSRMWGANVFTENDEVWRKHRRIIAPAFNARTYVFLLLQNSTKISFVLTSSSHYFRYTLVWKEAVATYHEMVATEGWTSKNTIQLRDVNPFMSKVHCTISRIADHIDTDTAARSSPLSSFPDAASDSRTSGTIPLERANGVLIRTMLTTAHSNVLTRCRLLRR